MDSTNDQLEEVIAEGAEVSGFLSSDLGKRFKKQLEDAYIVAITAAIDESPTYKEAIINIQKMASWINMKLSLSKIAKKQLDLLGRQDIQSDGGEEDWG